MPGKRRDLHLPGAVIVEFDQLTLILYSDFIFRMVWLFLLALVLSIPGAHQIPPGSTMLSISRLCSLFFAMLDSISGHGMAAEATDTIYLGLSNSASEFPG